MQPRSQWTGKNRLHIAHWGGNGAPLLLVHGLAGSVHWWDFMAAELSSCFEVAALDLQGHGDSDWDKGGMYTAEKFISNIEEARRFLDWEKIVLVGHSLGALLSVDYATRYPKNLKALIAIDFMPEINRSRARFPRLLPIRQPVFSDAEAMLKRFHLQPRETTLSESALKELARFLIKKSGKGYTWKCDWQTFLFRYDSSWPLLEKIQTLSLIIRGEHSLIMNRDDLQKTSRNFPQSKSLEIPEAYHHVPLDAPAATTEAIINFAKNLEID
jgi:pimeloyl-ACP methyl ester carboxylesterase